ncbi:MAG: matrixin family metalloprotease [Candidatus Binatia bacterium]
MKWRMINLSVVGFSLLAFSQGAAFVRSLFPSGAAVFWSDAVTTMNLQFGCPSGSPLTNWGPCWDDAAEDALNRWNTVATRFRFSWQRPTVAIDLCNHTNFINTAGFASSICGTGFGDALAVTIATEFSNGRLADADVLLDAGRLWSTYPGPLQRNGSGAGTVYDFHRVVMHEFGHVLGLDHPDQHGQAVTSLMNSRVSDIDDVQADDIAGVNAIYPDFTANDALLEDPQPGAIMSGLTILRGWACTAGRIDLQIDGVSFQAVYPTARGDTASICDDDGNNGFSLLFNWNLAGDGVHTVIALKDGVEFGRATVTVVTLGQEFLTGVNAQYRLPNFPTSGQNVIIEWRESLQNFVIVETE